VKAKAEEYDKGYRPALNQEKTFRLNIGLKEGLDRHPPPF